MLRVCSFARAFLAAGWIVVALCGSAVAQSAERSATAESLFREGKQLMDQQKYAEACVKLAASQELEPGMGTLLNLADCHEKLNMTASAWAEFLRAAALARAGGQAPREQVARGRAAALEQRLIRLRVSVPDEARVNGLEIKRGGVKIEEAAWSSAIPADPGKYTITASAPKKQTWSREIELLKEGGTVDVVIPTLADAAPEVPGPAPQGVAGLPDGLPPPARTLQPAMPGAPPPALGSDQAHPESSSSGSTIGLVVGGVGLVGIAVGSVLGLAAGSKWSDAEDGGCAQGACPTREAQDNADGARGLASGATIGLVGGGVLLVTGALVYLIASEEQEPEPSVGMRLSPQIVVGKRSLGGGLSVGSAF